MEERTSFVPSGHCVDVPVRAERRPQHPLALGPPFSLEPLGS